MESKEFTVTGMKCEHCEAKVEEALKAVIYYESNNDEEALKALPGIASAKADRTACKVAVSFDPVAVSPQQMKEAVDDLGRFEMQL